MKSDIMRKSGISALAVLAALAFAPVSAGAQQVKADGAMKLAQAEPERGGPGGPGGGGRGGGERGGGERGPGAGGPGGPGRGGPPPGARQAPQAAPQAAPQQAPMAQSPRNQGQPGGRAEQRQMQQQQAQPQMQMQQQQQPRMRMEQGRRMEQRDMRMDERRTVTRQRDFDRRGAYRNDDRRRDYGRARDRNVSSFVFLGGPRIVERRYGPGYCRGLHRGYHWAPRIGWHRGTHRGLFRC